MKKIMNILILVFFNVFTLLSQIPEGFLHPDQILCPSKEMPKVMLVGTWHFSYPGLDAHQTNEQHKINIYSDKRQKELEEVIDYIAKFKPSKILVESGPIVGYIINNYKRYKKGEDQLYINERSQIGMRLVDQFNLDTIYGVDAYPLLLEWTDRENQAGSEGSYFHKMLSRHYFGGEEKIHQRYTDLYAYRDSMINQKSILSILKYINSKEYLSRAFGPYINKGQFDSIDFTGADALSMYWVNRNLRIFKNIQDIDYSNEDRVVVLFGSAHVPLLRWFFTSSPNWEVVSFSELGSM